MKKIVIIIAISILAVIWSCEKQNEVFDLQKIDAHQRLNDVLQEIDEQIESIKLDTLQLGEVDLEEELAQSEEELAAMRDSVLNQIRRIDEMTEEKWEKFEASLDSTEKHVVNALEKARERISTMTPDVPPVPPL